MITEKDLKGAGELTAEDLYQIRNAFDLHNGGRKGAYREIAKRKKCSWEMVRSVLYGRRAVNSPLSRKIAQSSAQLADRLKRNHVTPII